jgi:hypothetical protein
VPSLRDQVKVEVAERRREPVRIVEQPRRPGASHLEPVLRYATPAQVDREQTVRAGWFHAVPSPAGQKDDLVGAGLPGAHLEP